jgi:hypothetical protein
MNPPNLALISGQGGSRISWDAVPESVRLGIEKEVRGRVVSAESQLGGFSPGLAARLTLDGGQSVFVKAAGPEPNPDAPELHRVESKIAGALPPEAPVSRLLSIYDDGNWVALIFEDAKGDPPRVPWVPNELARVLEAVDHLGEMLTPSPIEARPIATGLDGAFTGWRKLQADTELAAQIDGWAQRHLDKLGSLEEVWKESAEGETLLHLDVRADNVIISEDRVVIVDWPHAAVGARWIDLLFFLPSVAMQGGPKPWEILEDQPVLKGAEAKAVNSLLAAISGFFIYHSLLPPPSGLPTLREFQRLQGVEALAWLRRSAGWR